MSVPTRTQSITLDDISAAIQKMEDLRRFEELRIQEAIRNAVLICNRENKFKLKQAIPELCVLETDFCDNKIYMITDKELAENVRGMIRE